MRATAAGAVLCVACKGGPVACLPSGSSSAAPAAAPCLKHVCSEFPSLLVLRTPGSSRGGQSQEAEKVVQQRGVSVGGGARSHASVRSGPKNPVALTTVPMG